MREVGGEETERTLIHEELDHNKFSNLSSIILFEIHLTPEHQGPLKPGASHTISPGRRGGGDGHCVAFWPWLTPRHSSLDVYYRHQGFSSACSSHDRS